VKVRWDVIKDAVFQWFKKLVTVIAGNSQSEEGRWMRILILVSSLTVALLAVTSLSAFFLTLQGEEQMMVPDIYHAELVDALISLQQKGLNSEIITRFSSDPTLKGKVLSQEPSAGSLVKVGKRVRLVVSKGAIVGTVENFVGRNLEDVKTELRTLFATYDTLLRIQEPSYVFDKSPEGTILQQQPEPGTELTGLTDLLLVVSRGPEASILRLSDYTNMDFTRVISLLAQEEVPFVFSVAAPLSGREGGVVVGQSPPSGTEITQDTRIELEMTPPAKLRDNEVFGVFECTLPVHPVWLDMKFEALKLSGERRTIFSMKHPGGEVAIPYIEEENTTLILSIFNQVVRDIVVSR
jgi:beta-lactam-binding protein with PASTA domain